MRRVFFSFHYDNDIWEVNQVRHAWQVPGMRETQPIIDGAEFEKIRRQGDRAVQNWIDRNMKGCGVVAVLIGPETYSRRWVKYEIAKAHADGRGLIGISLEGMKRNAWQTKSAGPNPFGHAEVDYEIKGMPIVPIYNWVRNRGIDNIGNWVDQAAKAVGR